MPPRSARAGRRVHPLFPCTTEHRRGRHASVRQYDEIGEEFWADLIAKPPLETLRCRA
ncbi:hypothetical protein AB0B40_12340 [Streptomyces sp. NPDC042638]|uniref:hypothetical protein n=1 Tax=Streptomyces sp. NPDC042638 TaxID=3154333 RepID=UPI0034016838